PLRPRQAALADVRAEPRLAAAVRYRPDRGFPDRGDQGHEDAARDGIGHTAGGGMAAAPQAAAHRLGARPCPVAVAAARRRPAGPGGVRRLFILLAACAATAADAATLVLSGGTVIDGYGNPPIANGVIVIENDRILAVGGSDVAVPPGATVISTEGMTVLPGLWDVQVNLMRLGHADAARWIRTYGPLAEKVVMPIPAQQLLQAAVTTARDGPGPLDAAIHVRERIRDHLIEGPTLMVSGPLLRKAVAPGSEEWQWTVAGAEDARAKVLRLAGAGVDYILLSDVDAWTAEELTAAV